MSQVVLALMVIKLFTIQLLIKLKLFICQLLTILPNDTSSTVLLTLVELVLIVETVDVH